MPYNKKKYTNALFKLVLNRAFLFILVSTFGVSYTFGQGQNRNQLGNFISVNGFVNSQSKLRNNDSLLDNSAYRFDYRQAGISYKHNLYSKFNLADNNFTFSQVSIIPGLQLAHADFGKDHFTRNFINVSLGLLGIFHTSPKNTFMGVATAMANEDEYTLPNAYLKYAGAFIYSRKVNPKFSYRVGIAFSYVFGDPRVLPLLGARWQINKKSILNFTLPLNINYKHSTKYPNLFYGFSSRSFGGYNRFQNKLNIDTINRVLVMRRRSFQISADLKYISNKFTVIGQLGINVNQNVRFTEEGNNNVVNNFEFNGTNTLFARISFIFPVGGQVKHKKNKDSKPEPINSEDPAINDEINDSWMDF